MSDDRTVATGEDGACVPDVDYWVQLSRMRMPFGKYEGRRLIDLPESYLVWFSRNGYPSGALGTMLQSVFEIKLNGLEYLFGRESEKPDPPAVF